MTCNVNKLEHTVTIVSGCRLLSAPPVAKPQRLWPGWRWQERCTLHREGWSISELFKECSLFWQISISVPMDYRDEMQLRVS